MHSYIPPHRFFPYLTWTEIHQMPDKENTVILQPIGAIEQHGPHLPLIVDAAISTAVLGKALEQLDPAIPAYALPPLYYGKSNEHWHFPGTITLSAETLTAILMEVGQSLHRARVSQAGLCQRAWRPATGARNCGERPAPAAGNTGVSAVCLAGSQ